MISYSEKAFANPRKSDNFANAKTMKKIPIQLNIKFVITAIKFN